MKVYLKTENKNPSLHSWAKPGAPTQLKGEVRREDLTLPWPLLTCLSQAHLG